MLLRESHFYIKIKSIFLIPLCTENIINTLALELSTTMKQIIKNGIGYME